jgi:hypothetical protein
VPVAVAAPKPAATFAAPAAVAPPKALTFPTPASAEDDPLIELDGKALFDDDTGDDEIIELD